MHDLGLLTLFLIFAVGLFAGAISVMAGGGALVVMPLLVELGFPGPAANGTLRLGIFAQSFAAIVRFRRGGIALDPALFRILAAVLPGGALGAYFGVRLDGVYFRYVLTGVMVAVWLWMALGWCRKKHTITAPRDSLPSWRALLLLSLVGLYGGFLQVGSSFLIMAILHRGLKYDLVRVNILKVWIIAGYTIIAIPIFAYSGNVDWVAGAALALGTALGGWFGAKITLSHGEKWVRIVFSIALVGLIGRLAYSAYVG